MAKLKTVTQLFLAFSSIILISHAISPLQFEDYKGIFHPNDEEKLENLRFSSRADSVRLPKSLLPISYDLFLRPILDEIEDEVQFDAPGHVRITFDCVETTKNITLHTNGPRIAQQSIMVIRKNDNVSLPIANFYEDPDNFKHFFIIEMIAFLQIGATYEIYIEFNSYVQINAPSFDGLYYGTYWDHTNNDNKSYAATQMQATHARQVFPLFDEPSFKAIFNVKIARRAEYHVRANAEWISTEDLEDFPGWFVDSFAPTPKMSSYLLAILISDFTYVETFLDDGRPIRTYASPDLIASGGGNYSVEQAAKIIQFLETEFEQPYPVAKMDSVALQNFSSGGMENYGLNKYIIPFLLKFNGQTIEHDRFMINILLGHELGHQWFGNLATCDWWGHTWLNEGLVSYIHYMVVNQVAPEFNTNQRFVTEAVQYAMQLDVRETAHPLVNNAQTPPEIDAIFSRISYEKGAVMARMMEGFLGRETFLKGLRLYLERMKFSTAVTDDLWDAINEVAHADGAIDGTLTIKEIMDPWVLQKGFPLIRVTKASEGRIFISQEKFTQNLRKRSKRNIDTNELWFVPITIVTAEDADFENFSPKLWVQNKMALRVHEINTNQWMILNPGAMGYYRVMYDQTLLELIKNQIRMDPSVINEISRSQLLDDYFNLAFNSYTQIENALDLTILLSNENQRVVWDTYFTNFRKSFNMFSSTETFDHLRTYLLPYLDNALNLIGLEQNDGDIGDVVILRNQILDWACSMGSLLCKSYTEQLFADWDLTPEKNPVPIDIQRVIYCSAVSGGSFDMFNRIFEKYRDIETSPVQRGHFLSSLGCTKEISLLQLMLENALDESNGFQRSDAITAMEKVAGNVNGRRVAFNFLRNNYQDIVDYMGTQSTTTAISRVVTILSNYFNTKAEHDEVLQWIEKLKSEGAPENLISALSNSANVIESNVQWMENYQQNMKNWFIQQNKN